MQRRLLIGFFLMVAGLGLAACTDAPEAPREGGDAEASASPGAAAAELGGVVAEASLTLGSFDGTVTDLTAIEAYPLGFQGRLLAANGAAGVQMIQVDGTYIGVMSPTLQAEGKVVTLTASTYAFGDAGLALQYMPRADGLNGIELVDPDAPTATPLRRWSIDDDLVDLCISQDTAVVVTARGNVGRFTVSPDVPDGPPIRTVPGLSNMTACHGLPSFLLVSDGVSVTDILAEEPAPVRVDPAADALVETAEGLVSLTVTEDGALAVDGERIQLTDDQRTPVRAEMILAEGGNFGGILRDGMVAVLDDGGALHVVPWSAVANGLGLSRTALSRRKDDDLERSDLAVEEDAEALMSPEPRVSPFEQELPQPPAR